MPWGVFFKESFLEDPWRYLMREGGEHKRPGKATQEQTEPSKNSMEATKHVEPATSDELSGQAS